MKSFLIVLIEIIIFSVSVNDLYVNQKWRIGLYFS